MSDLEPYEEPTIGREIPPPSPTLQESTRDVLAEQKQAGQINKPLEMLLSITHLLTGGRAAPTATHTKEREDKIVTQNVQSDIEPERVVKTEELTARNEQFYDTGQDFLDPFEGDMSNEDLRKENNLDDPLSSDAWIPTFVYKESELELVPKQTGYDSIDTSAESVHFTGQLNIGEVPD